MPIQEKSFFSRAQELRSQIQSDSSIFKEELTHPLAVAYLWPTKYCPVGCEHCMFASPKLQEVDRGMILSPQAVDNFIKISHESRLIPSLFQEVVNQC